MNRTGNRQGNRRGAEAAEIAEGRPRVTGRPDFAGIWIQPSSLRPPRPLRLCGCLGLEHMR